MKINNIPVRTWNRLKVNDVEVDVSLPKSLLEYTEVVPNEVDSIVGKGIGHLADISVRTGLGKEFDDLISDSNHKVSGYVVSENTDAKKPLYQTFEIGDEKKALNILDYTVEENGNLTVIQTIKEKNDMPATYLMQNKLRVAKNATLTIVQVQMLSDKKTFLNDFGAHLCEGGSLNLIQIVLGGKESYYGLFTELEGPESKVEASVAYTMSGSSKLDMNYVANHHGKNTESNFNVSGVLKDRAYKLFKGTLDFHKGCSGANGAELENVLLIDDTITNKTVPLILCDEEDVSGAHGATIGKLREDLLLYMKSRGIDEKEAYRIMERAQIDAVANKIDDKKTREEITDYLDKIL